MYQDLGQKQEFDKKPGSDITAGLVEAPGEVGVAAANPW